MRFDWLPVSTGVAVFAFAVASCSQNSASVADDGPLSFAQQAIQGGTVDTTHSFAVGVCIGPTGGNNPPCAAVCSGALIAPNVVVTARHCVQTSPEIIDCSQSPTFGSQQAKAFAITTSPQMLSGNPTWHAVDSFVTPSDTHVCGNDIALLVLADTIDASEATPITPGVEYPMTSARYARTYTAIGYGMTAPSTGTAGTRYIRQGIPIECPTATVSCPTAAMSASEFGGGDGACPGDSGSSAFDDNSFSANGGQGAVSFGVLSRGETTKTACEGAIYTRLDAFRDMVVSTVETASQNWTLYPEPSWTGDATEPQVPDAPDAGAAEDSGVAANTPAPAAPTPTPTTAPSSPSVAAPTTPPSSAGCSVAVSSLAAVGATEPPWSRIGLGFLFVVGALVRRAQHAAPLQPSRPVRRGVWPYAPTRDR
ncbi:MAG: trypsin-like serine protease [Polyangiaceae bacterium]|nr:trypsin-like serine protease [Polyangiaceae bacterium]